MKITGTWMEKKNCQMHGQASQESFYSHCPGGELQTKQTTSRPDDVWPDMWKFMSDAAKKKKAHQRWAIENQSSTMPDN